MKVVLAGASGMIGEQLHTRLLAGGHDVTTLVRRTPSSAAQRRWSPEQHELDPDHLIGADAVICLSGAGVGDHRWNEDYKRTIVSSRVDSVGTIARTLAGLHGCRTTLVCASAVGFYGDTGDRPITEDAPSGDDFLASVCRQWEAAADPARDAGLRVVHLRTGLVLGDGGLLGRLTLLYRAGLGGRLGSGTQYMPWISITDEVAAIEFCAMTDTIRGPVNLTAPNPVTNAEFTRALAHELHRPALLPVPGFALRVALGEFAETVLGGQRALPAALTEHGFVPALPDLGPALRSVL